MDLSPLTRPYFRCPMLQTSNDRCLDVSYLYTHPTQFLIVHNTIGPRRRGSQLHELLLRFKKIKMSIRPQMRSDQRNHLARGYRSRICHVVNSVRHSTQPTIRSESELHVFPPIQHCLPHAPLDQGNPGIRNGSLPKALSRPPVADH